MNKALSGIMRLAVTASLVLAAMPATVPAADPPTNSADSTAAAAPQENGEARDVLRSYLQIQEQLRSARLAIEQNRLEGELAATRNTDLIAQRLQRVEQSLAAQRESEMENLVRSMENLGRSNHQVLIAAGAFLTIGFVAMLLLVRLQWKVVNRIAEFHPASVGMMDFGVERAPSEIELAAGQAQGLGGPDPSSLRLIEAIERLEKRILELEHSTRTPLGEKGPPTESASEPASRRRLQEVNPPSEVSASSPPAPANQESEGGNGRQITVLIAKGQTLLDLDQVEKAIGCFDEALAMDSNHAEALLKKGSALERLRRTDEAIQYYDRAIAADGSMTIAYLCKGGLCNRLERHREALECYERALRTQERGRAN